MFLQEESTTYYDEFQQSGCRKVRIELTPQEYNEIKAWERTDEAKDKYYSRFPEPVEYAIELCKFRQAYYGGPGRAFIDALSWRVTKGRHRLLWISQRFGMDV